MNGRVIPGAEINTFRLMKISANECDSGTIVFVSRGITVYEFQNDETYGRKCNLFLFG